MVEGTIPLSVGSFYFIRVHSLTFEDKPIVTVGQIFRISETNISFDIIGYEESFSLKDIEVLAKIVRKTDV